MAVLTGVFTFACASAAEYDELFAEVDDAKDVTDSNGNRLLNPQRIGQVPDNRFTVEYRNETFTRQQNMT